MVVYDEIEINGDIYDHHYSDEGYKIRLEGTKGPDYDEAIDILGSGKVYIETDKKID